MVFLDHLKPLYTVDIKVMEEEGLIGPVSLFLAWFLLCRQRRKAVPSPEVVRNTWVNC
jgi:hypothetical protein